MNAYHVRVDISVHSMGHTSVSALMATMRMISTPTFVPNVITHVQLVYSQEPDRLVRVAMWVLLNIGSIMQRTQRVVVM